MSQAKAVIKNVKLKIYIHIQTHFNLCTVYIDMGLSSNSPVVLTVVTAGNSFARSFSVKVTQIECNSLAKGEQQNILESL